MEKEKIKNFVKDHKCELIALGTGITITYIVMRKRNKAYVNELVGWMNDHLADAFYERDGNFTNADGTYDAIQWYRKTK